MLEFDAATKRFGDVAALDGCTFAAEPGRLTGFLGPNGAGLVVFAGRVYTGAILRTGPTVRLRDSWRRPTAPGADTSATETRPLVTSSRHASHP